MSNSRIRRTPIKTDPELTLQLDAAQGTDRSVEVVLLLRSPGTYSAAEGSGVREAAESAVSRVEQEVGTPPEAVNVLTNLGMVVVAASEPFVRRLLDQPEFESAMANASEESNLA